MVFSVTAKRTRQMPGRSDTQAWRRRVDMMC
jgi:hypothetical protein